MSWEIKHAKGEVLHGILEHISGYKDGARWSEIRDYMVRVGFAGKNNQVSMTLNRPLEPRYSVCNERGFCTKITGRWKLNERGAAKLIELRGRFKAPEVETVKTVQPSTAIKVEASKVETVQPSVTTVIDNADMITAIAPIKVDKTDSKITITIEVHLRK